MKDIAIILIYFFSIVFMVGSATFLMYHGIEGWGWLVVIIILSLNLNIKIKGD